MKDVCASCTWNEPDSNGKPYCEYHERKIQDEKSDHCGFHLEKQTKTEKEWD